MCSQKLIISVREVFQEIKSGSDELYDWAKKYEEIFLEPSDEELNFLQELLPKFYPALVTSYNAKGCADPFIIGIARNYGLSIIQHEVIKGNSVRIPYVAKHYGLNCIRLPQFFIEQNWEF
jgi:hypothetical protein